MIFKGKKFQVERAGVLRQKLVDLRLNQGRVLSLASFYFANDKASCVYTRVKEQLAQELGIKFVKYGIEIKAEADLDRVGELIKLEADKVDGVLIQKPSSFTLPERDKRSHSRNVMDRDEVFYRLAANVPTEKDVDVVSPMSLGRLVMINDPVNQLWPATVRAVFWVLAAGLGVYEKQADNPFKLMADSKALEAKRVAVVGARGGRW